MTLRLPTGLLLVCVLALAQGACKDDPKDGADAGVTPKPDAGEVTDGGLGDGGIPKCESDTACPANQYCQLASGECLDAKACQQHTDCEYQEVGQQDYCEFGGCFCDLERNGGTCLPRTGLCKTCERDVECGEDAFIYLDFTAKCRTFGGGKVCLPNREGPCPPAYVTSDDGTHCVPAGGSCDAVPACARDADCDPTSERPVCDTTQGFCKASCFFDYQRGTSDCPPNQVCHVDGRLLEGSNPNFGGGKCGAPCDAAENPTVCGEKTACEADGDPLLVNPRIQRCRPPAPKCVRDADCPSAPDVNSRGFCNRDTLECSTGCRRENDCVGGYKCLRGECSEKTCIENGGAVLACNLGAFCCGEPSSVEPCPTGVSLGQCYEAPNPPWCEVCSAVGPAQTPGGGGRPKPSVCVEVTEGPGAGLLVMHSCDPLKPQMCPRGWGCGAPPPCEVDADCGTGGKCGQVQSAVGVHKACICNAGESCPANSKCQNDADGNPSACVGGWCALNRCFPPP